MNIVDQHVLIQNGRELDGVLNGLKVAVVLIYASWCPFCRRFLPVFQRYAAGNANLLYAQDDQEILATRYDVEVVPSVLCFQNGALMGRLDGVYGIGLTEPELEAFLKKVLVAE